ncbi:MAG: zinc metallopeptidase, partial [Eubacteriales bacterium]|nr:zinc metallopeptidase [Eubacteriales bacterium]
MYDLVDVGNPAATLSDPLLIVTMILLGLLVVASVIAGIITLALGIKYWRYNRKPVQSGLTGIEAARKLLDESGLENVQVQQAGFLRALIYGNYYSRRAKTVFLRRNIANRNSVTAVGV